MDKQRFTGYEMNAMMHAHAAECAMDKMAPLEKRLRSAGLWSMYRGAFGMVTKIVDRLEDEMPDRQHNAHILNCKTMVYNCDVKRPAVNNTDNGLWVSYAALDTLMGAVKESCLTCMKDPQQMRSCPLQKAMDELPMIRADYKNHNCPYFGGI